MISCPVALRDALLDRGFELRLAGDVLLVSPASQLTDEDRSTVRHHLPTLKALTAGGTTASYIEAMAANRAKAFDPISGRPRCHQCGQEAPADGRHECLACRAGDIPQQARHAVTRTQQREGVTHAA